MAEASVNFLLAKLQELLQGEEQLLRGVQEDAEHIGNELECMKAFLRVADPIEDSDPRLKVLVKMVREVAYDMEDALDDCKLCLVRDHQHGKGTYAALQKLSFAIKTLGPRHRIASQLRSIKSRVQNLADRQRRYSDMNNEFMRPANLTKQTRGAPALTLEADLVGIEEHKNELIVQLVRDRPDRYVVSVVGMGGLGKSTLVRRVYDDPRIKNHFKFRAWIPVSQYYKIEDLLKNVIQQLYRVLKKPEPQGLDNMDSERLRDEIDHLLKQKRYLIVLDDVWHINVWEEFNVVLPNNKSRSRVLFTTRNEGIAFHSCQGAHENIYNLTPLSPEDSETLFCKKIFKNSSCPSNLREVAGKFLRGCEGLPLAIVAITGVLSTKDISLVDEWEMVYDSFGDALRDSDMLESLKTILSLSYNDLPYYLKSCLLYLSIFPQGNPIERMKIVRMWVAEGFVEEREGMSLEDVADSHLTELIKRNLVKVVEMTSDGRIKTCRIHDILREIMISKSKDQVFAEIVKDQNKMWPENVRRLSIHNATASIQQRQMGSGSRLRSLLMFWATDPSPESTTFKLSLHHLRFLNVLNLEGAPLTEFPDHVVNLFLLKYLSLRNTKVNSIPGSIEKLRNLETLDMKHAQATELPVQILKLQKLRHLLVYRYVYHSDDPLHTKYGVKSPRQIGKLESIQKLCFLEVDQDRELLIELGKLTQLRRLGIVKLREADGKVLCASICKLTNLRALSVTSATEPEEEIINMDHLSSPPRFLQRLYLTGRLRTLPEWISSLHSLTKLVLKGSRLPATDDPLSPLQDLPNLVHLALMQVYGGEELRFRGSGFQKLKFLGLNGLDRLNSIVLEEGAVACLEKLVVHSCSSLHKVPLGIEHLAKLKELEFFDMPNELVASLRDTGDGDYKRIEHVHDVYFIDRNNDYLNKYDFKS